MFRHLFNGFVYRDDQAGTGEGAENLDELEIGDDFDYDAEGEKRGYKALFQENKKKAEALKTVKSEMETLKSQLKEIQDKQAAGQGTKATERQIDETEKRFTERMKARGFDDDDIKSFIDMSERRAAVIANRSIAPFRETGAKSALKNAMDKVMNESGDELKSILKKVKIEQVEDMLAKRKIPSDYWGDTDVVDSAMFGILRSDPKLLKSSQGYTPEDIPGETGGGTGGSGSGGESVADREVMAYADERGLDVKTPADIANVRRILKLKKEADKAKDKKHEELALK
ncbi:MAG: hypothetical protein KJ888_21010 [Gammaproteobacteria bacterium]|nr:hypothetical protein [Gammaproteobacteria bacterium]